MGQLIAELEVRQPDLPYFDSDHSGPYPAESPVVMEDFNELYPAAAARVAEDAAFAEKARNATAALQQGRPGYIALWQHFRNVSIEALKAVYDDLDIGMYTRGVLGDLVFDDLNRNGIQDSGETGNAGDTVELLDTGGAGGADEGDHMTGEGWDG